MFRCHYNGWLGSEALQVTHSWIQHGLVTAHRTSFGHISSYWVSVVNTTVRA